MARILNCIIVKHNFSFKISIQTCLKLHLYLFLTDMQTSNISIWRYHCLGEVAFLKIWNQYWSLSDTVHQRVFVHLPCPSSNLVHRSLESTLVNGLFKLRCDMTFFSTKEYAGHVLYYSEQTIVKYHTFKIIMHVMQLCLYCMQEYLLNLARVE